MKPCANPKCDNAIPHYDDERYNKREYCSKRCKNRVCALIHYHRMKAKKLSSEPSDVELTLRLINYFEMKGWEL